MKTEMNTQSAPSILPQDTVRGEMVNQAVIFSGASTQALKAPRLRLLQRRDVRRNRRLAH